MPGLFPEAASGDGGLGAFWEWGWGGKPWPGDGGACCQPPCGSVWMEFQPGGFQWPVLLPQASSHPWGMRKGLRGRGFDDRFPKASLPQQDPL